MSSHDLIPSLLSYRREGLDLADLLLGALMQVAPDGKAQKLLTTQFNEAIQDGGREEALRWAMEAVWNGIKFGNWPWN